MLEFDKTGEAGDSGPSFVPSKLATKEAVLFLKCRHMAERQMQTWDSAGYGGPLSGVWNKQNTEGSDLIPPPLPFVFRLKTKEDLQEPRVSCLKTVFST